MYVKLHFASFALYVSATFFTQLNSPFSFLSSTRFEVAQEVCNTLLQGEKNAKQNKKPQAERGKKKSERVFFGVAQLSRGRRETKEAAAIEIFTSDVVSHGNLTT